MRVLRITVVAFLLMTAAICAWAGTYTYSFNRSLGTHYLSNTVQPRAFSLGTQFSSIDSVTFHMKGRFNSGSPTVGAFVSQIITAYQGSNVRGVGYAPYAGSISAEFDLSYTLTDQSPYYTEWRQYMCSNKLTEQLTFQTSNGSINPDGYVTLDACNVTIVGTPVPEPSSILAILCGITGLSGGIIWKRRSA